MNSTEIKIPKAVSSIFGKLEIRQVKMNCILHGEYLANQVFLGGKLKEISGCPKCHEEHLAQRAIDEEKRRKEETEKNRQARIKETRMPLEYQTKDFSTFITETESQRDRKSVV